MAANAGLVKTNVQRILADRFKGVELWKDGFTLRHDSARLFVEIEEQPERVMIKLTCLLLSGCQASPDLFRHIALHGDDYFFGHLSARESGDKVDIYFTHVLLGDFLDDDELEHAVGGMLFIANNIDDTLEKEFGGERFHAE